VLAEIKRAEFGRILHFIAQKFTFSYKSHQATMPVADASVKQ